MANNRNTKGFVMVGNRVSIGVALLMFMSAYGKDARVADILKVK